MKTLIISLGNPIKSDDNIGNLVVDWLSKQIKEQSTIFIRAETTPENYFYKAAELKPQIIYIIDAVDFNGSVGDVKVFDYNDIVRLPMATTHNIPITLLSGFVGKAVIKLIAIQPKNVDVGEEISTEMQERFREICDKIKNLLI